MICNQTLSQLSFVCVREQWRDTKELYKYMEPPWGFVALSAWRAEVRIF